MKIKSDLFIHLFLGLEPHPEELRGYSWLLTKESLLVGSRFHIEYRECCVAMCMAKTLSSVLSIWTKITFSKVNFFASAITLNVDFFKS